MSTPIKYFYFLQFKGIVIKRKQTNKHTVYKCRKIIIIIVIIIIIIIIITNGQAMTKLRQRSISGSKLGRTASLGT